MNKPILDEENELRELMTRVMAAPLTPLQAKMDNIAAQIKKLEETTTKNGNATRNLDDAIGKVNKDLKNGFAELKDEAIVELKDELIADMKTQVAPLTHGLAEVCQQQALILQTGNDGLHHSIALAATMHDSMIQLQQLNTNVQRTTKHVLDMFVALKANQTAVGPILTSLQAKAVETSDALQEQHLLIEAFKHALPTLLQDMRQELQLSLFTGLEARQTAILATVERKMAEQQQSLFSRLTLLKTLAVTGLVALACVVGLAAILVIRHIVFWG